MGDGGTIRLTIQNCGISMRKRQAYHKKRLSERELNEVNEFLARLDASDGELKFQALVDYYRSKGSSVAFTGHNPRSINPEGEEL